MAQVTNFLTYFWRDNKKIGEAQKTQKFEDV